MKKVFLLLLMAVAVTASAQTKGGGTDLVEPLYQGEGL